MRVLISGATGLLGNNLVRMALQRGVQVTSFSRSDRQCLALKGLEIDYFQGDLADRKSLSQIFEKPVDAIVHCAAHIHIGWKFVDSSMLINRDGTQFLLDEAAKRRIRFIHVSTVNTLAVGSKDQVVDEETLGDGRVPCNYVLTKMAAERVAVESAAAGNDVLIVHPGFMLGPWDWKPSSGRMIQALQGFAPLAPSGGCSVCDPRDVSEAILNAIDRGESGRHYILGGENIMYLDLWNRICAGLRKKGPFTILRKPGQLILGSIGDILSKFRRDEMDINSAAIAISSQTQWFSSQRAIAELGYRPRPVDESIRDAIQWLGQYNFLKTKVSARILAK